MAARRFAVTPFNKSTAFEGWIESEGVPVVRDFVVGNLRSVELRPWARMGGNGAWLVLGSANDQSATTPYVCEIPPGGKLEPEKHMYEEMIFILDGVGATEVWIDEKKKQAFEWGPNSLFAPPLNTWHRLVNGSGQKPVRFMALTNAPAVFNLYHNVEFVFDNPFVFRDRYEEEQDYFSRKGEQKPGRVWDSNFIADINELSLHEWKERGPAARNVEIELAHNTIAGHISEGKPCVYRKAHRHGPGAYIFVLEGKGYSLMWPEGGTMKKYDWGAGSLFTPPNRWFHQHFTTSKEPVKRLALKGWGQKYPIGGWDLLATGTDEGGDMIEYEDEDPSVRRMYEEEIKKVGMTLQMPPVSYKRRSA
jgi:mannose-6-phosphate isomerase-like protein (cupin superfamily)